jgi:DNA-binding response OmpR family regulator
VAEDILCGSEPDVLFLDMQLPDFGAFRIAGRAWDGVIPAIICTTAFDRPLLEVMSRYQVEYLVRPFGPEELM